MAERIVSPGVYTREIDQSFLPAAIRSIGAAVVGSTVKGPALIPTTISSFSDFTSTFGGFTDESYVPFVVQDYLQNAQNITVTRLLYEGGYDLDNGVVAIIATSGSGAGEVTFVSHLLHPTQPVNEAADLLISSSLAYDESGSFAIKISGSYTGSLNTDVPGFNGSFESYPTTGTSLSASIIQSDNNYLTKIFGTNPKSIDYPVYIQYENNAISESFANIGAVTASAEVINSYDFSDSYSSAATPWITSQKIGSSVTNLFKFHSLSDGNTSNYDVKVSIRNIRLSSEIADPNGYGSFTVEIRRVNSSNFPSNIKSIYPVLEYTDTDTQPEILETFQNVNLDPTSPQYISRVIGDRYQTFDSVTGLIVLNGNYNNSSKYVRVEVTDSVANGSDPTLVPFGFRALQSPIPDTSGGYNLAAATYNTSQTINGNYNANNTHGFNFTYAPNISYLSPIPKTGASTGSNTDFYLGNVSQDLGAAYPNSTSPYTGTLQSALTSGTFTSKIKNSTRNFIIPMQGGFDGARPNLPKFAGSNIKSNNTFGFDCSSASTSGTISYNKAFTLLGNTDFYDLNMLLTPGIIHSLHSNVSSAARTLAETRQDTFYVLDLVQENDSITTAINTVTSIDSSYTATYYPWVQITNPLNSLPTWVPPSVVMPGVIAFNDSQTAPWYAPAGLNRGGLTTVNNTKVNLNPTQRGDLYEARINPIANLPALGAIAVWGQKTLQAIPSALDRVNVRRLLIAVKKYIASATQFLVFEPNDSATRKRIEQIVNPYLESVKQQRGLYAFRIKMDSENNTPDLIDQNILYGQIFLQPTRTAEFIIIDFNIQPTGAAFPE